MIRRPTRAFVAAAAVVTVATVAAERAPATGAEAMAASRPAVTSRPAAASAPGSSRAALTAFACHRALKPSDRSMSATAVMRPVAETVKLAVDFRLLRLSATGTATSVPGAGLDTWLTNSVGTGANHVWRVIHTVSDLPAPASYRFSVAFRWIGSGGQIIARAVRRSRRCRQPELRPDLEVQSIAVREDPSKPSEDSYVAGIYDAGASGAGPFLVQLLDQGKQVNRRVSHIDRHELLSVRFVGPPCSSAAPPTVTVDPHHRVDVYSRAHASLTATCPAASDT